MSGQKDRGLISYDFGGIASFRMERSLATSVHERLGRWKSENGAPGLIVQWGDDDAETHLDPWTQTTHVFGGGLPVVRSLPKLADDMLFSPGKYQIVRRGAIYEVQPDRIVCSGPVYDPFFEQDILQPVINNRIVPKGTFLAHACGVSMGKNVLVFMGETGKTSLLLEFLMRGAGYLANENLFLEPGGKCTMYSTWMDFKERHIRLFPELMDVAFSDGRERGKQEKLLSLYRMGMSLQDGNSPLKTAGNILTSRFHFAFSCSFERLFPKVGLMESGRVTHVFLLEGRHAKERLVRSTAEEIARIEAASTWIKTGNHHNTLAELAGMDHCSKGDMNAVLLDSIRQADCYAIRVEGRSERTRSQLGELVDQIEGLTA